MVLTVLWVIGFTDLSWLSLLWQVYQTLFHYFQISFLVSLGKNTPFAISLGEWVYFVCRSEPI